jgi:tRNA G26 N,N-dimethylase Trm1
VDFYVRLFMRVKNGAEQCHHSIKKYSHVYQCMECEAFYLQNMGLEVSESITVDDKGNKKKTRTKLDNVQ